MRNSKLIALLSAAALVVSSMSGLMLKGGDALAAPSQLGDADHPVTPILVSDDVIVVQKGATQWTDKTANDTYVDVAELGGEAGDSNIKGKKYQRIALHGADKKTAWNHATVANDYADRTGADAPTTVNGDGALASDVFVIGAGHDSELVFQIKDPGDLIDEASDIELHVNSMTNSKYEDAFGFGTNGEKIGMATSAVAVVGVGKDATETWEVHVFVTGEKTLDAIEEPGYFWFTSRKRPGNESPNDNNYFRFQISNYAHQKFVNGSSLIKAGGHTADDIIPFDRLPYGVDAENAYIEDDRYEVAYTWKEGANTAIYRRHETAGDAYNPRVTNYDMVVAFLTNNVPVEPINGNSYCGVTALTENRDVNITYSYKGGDNKAVDQAVDNPTKPVKYPAADAAAAAAGEITQTTGTDSILAGSTQWTAPSYFRNLDAEGKVINKNLYKATEIIQINDAVKETKNTISIIANGVSSALMVREGNRSICSSGVNEDEEFKNIQTAGYEQLGDTKPTSMNLNAVMRTGSKYLNGDILWVTDDPHSDIISLSADSYLAETTAAETVVRAVGNGQATLYVVAKDSWTFQNTDGNSLTKAKAAYDAQDSACKIVFTCTENEGEVRVWKYTGDDTKRGAEITGTPKSIDVYTQGPTNEFFVILTGQVAQEKDMTMSEDAASLTNVKMVVDGVNSDIATMTFVKKLQLKDDVDPQVPAALYRIVGKKIGETTANFTGTYTEVSRTGYATYTRTIKGDLLISVKEVYENDQNIKPDTVFQVGDATYKVLADGTVELVKYNGTDTVVTIDTVDYNGKTYTVSKVGKKAFAAKTLLASVTFGAGVKAIDNGAFKKCTNLKKVEFQGALTSAGKNVFLNAGKKGGKKLTVKLADGTDDAAKKALKKSNKNAKIK